MSGATGERPPIRGAVVDDETRCAHYASPLDVVAIRFFCCDEFYPCHLCHEESAGHAAARWPVTLRGSGAILCGVCAAIHSIEAYLSAERCPACAAAFNPGCRAHEPLYFDPAPGDPAADAPPETAKGATSR